MRYEVKITEINENHEGTAIYTQVVDYNPLKAVVKAINSMRIRKPKEAVKKTDPIKKMI